MDSLMYRWTLRWVNHWRRKLGDPELDQLVLGRPGDSTGCAVAASIGHEASLSTTLWTLHGLRGRTFTRMIPFWVTSFIRRFDHGHYPGLAMTLREQRELASLADGLPNTGQGTPAEEPPADDELPPVRALTHA